jgi:hypothetical protein
MYSAAVEPNIVRHLTPDFFLLLGPLLNRYTTRRHKMGVVSSRIYFKVMFNAAHVACRSCAISHSAMMPNTSRGREGAVATLIEKGDQDVSSRSQRWRTYGTIVFFGLGLGARTRVIKGCKRERLIRQEGFVCPHNAYPFFLPTSRQSGNLSNSLWFGSRNEESSRRLNDELVVHERDGSGRQRSKSKESNEQGYANCAADRVSQNPETPIVNARECHDCTVSNPIEGTSKTKTRRLIAGSLTWLRAIEGRRTIERIVH